MLNPIEDVIVVEPNYGKESISAGGVVIPETVESPDLVTGTVVAVGPGKVSSEGVLIPVNVKVGQKIWYLISSTFEVVHEGEKFHFVDETIVLAVE